MERMWYNGIVLEKPLDSLTFTAFDFETTGLNPAKDRIIEIGAVRVRGGVIGETFHTLVNPGIPIPPEATAIHGITDADVASQPLVAEVFPEFLEFISGTVLFAHNAPFDMRFLQQALRTHGLPDHRLPVLDTLTFARRVFPCRYSYSLQNLAAWLGLDAQNAHSALDDALVCARLFQICVIRSGGGSTLTIPDLRCEVQLPVR